MSVKKVEMYTVICDNCGVSADEDTDYSCWNDESFAKDVAGEADFLIEGDLHYCPNCYTYGDDDELIIDESRKSNHAKRN